MNRGDKLPPPKPHDQDPQQIVRRLDMLDTPIADEPKTVKRKPKKET